MFTALEFHGMGRHYNVILLIFDTLRSDYLSCYRGDMATPSFESVADRGVVFESAFSTAPGTPISHASLYSGLYPSEHGVTGQYISLPEDVPVMAEWFHDAGYDTFGITGPSKMGSDWGYDRGFDELFEPYYEFPSATSWKNIYRSLVDRRFRRYFLQKVTRGGQERTRFKFDLLRDTISSELRRPFFTLCNFTTVHAPYNPPRPYKTRMTPEYSQPKLFLFEYLLGEQGSIDDPDIRLDRVMNIQKADGIGRYLADPNYLNEKEIELVRNWYAAAVKYLDDELGRFLEFYSRNLADDTVLLLTADHGEQLGEHGLWEHSHCFYDETLKIPLIAVGPGLPEGKRREDLASHVDVFDTLCDLCDLDRPRTTSGRSLFTDDERDAVFMEYGERDLDDFSNNSGHGRYLNQDQLRRFCAGRKAVRTHQYRFEITSNGTEHLFELPGQNELQEAPPDVVEDLRTRISETLGEEFGVWPEDDPESIRMNEQMQKNLRSLGYID